MTDPDDALRRQSAHTAAWSRVFVLGMILIMLGLLGRVVQLKVHPSARLLHAVSAPMSTRPEFAKRGDLFDARNRLLATSTIGYRLFVDPTQVDDTRTIAVDIAHAIDGSAVEIDKKIIERPGRQYVVIEDLLEDWQVDAIRRAQLRGVGLEPRLVRHYPHGDLAASLIGMVGFEHTGLSGTEHVFDETLTAHDGRLTYLRDVGRRALWIEPHDYIPGEDGRDVHLSIDLVIQQTAVQRLRAAVHKYNAAGGRIVVLNCRTGEILAMGDVLNPSGRVDALTVAPAPSKNPALRRNRCISDPYEPGSTFKPFIWAAATELDKAEPDEIIPAPTAPAYRTTQGRRIRDSHYYGPISWRTVLVKSINSGMAIVAQRMTHDEMRDAVMRFGFGAVTRCGVPGESAGLVTSAANWSHYSQTSVPMGHEIAVTPVQMVRAFSAFARDGTMADLRITAETDDHPEYKLRRQAVSEPIARLVREVLREVMLEGTGRRAQSQLYQLFGKSGTAQLPNPGGGGYFEDRYISSFIAGAPYEAPRIVVLCVIDDPDKALGHLGGTVAGPAVRDVIDETLTYLGVPPDQPDDAFQSLSP